MERKKRPFQKRSLRKNPSAGLLPNLFLRGISAPSYHSAAMDGIVVRAEDTYGTTEKNPKILKIEKDALWVNTGHSIPEGYNAVIMIEKIHQVDDEHIEIRSPAYPWQHIRKVGEDIVATQILFPQNHVIRAYDMGALVSAGVNFLKVWEKPVVAIIPTGSELVHHMEIKTPDQLQKGKIIESNSVTISGLILESRALPVVYDIIPDFEKDIGEAIRKAVDSKADLIMVNAGSSAAAKTILRIS